jgi:hypothetical protein
MISYDAESMYKQAQGVKNWGTSVLLCYAFAGLIAGLSGGYGVWASAGGQPDDQFTTLALGALFGGVLGCLVGNSYAFIIRIVLHTMLCLAQIEQNTGGLRSDLLSTIRPAGAGRSDDGAGSLLIRR